jgi:hypothetical protein
MFRLCIRQLRSLGERVRAPWVAREVPEAEAIAGRCDHLPGAVPSSCGRLQAGGQAGGRKVDFCDGILRRMLCEGHKVRARAAEAVAVGIVRERRVQPENGDVVLRARLGVGSDG